MITRSSGQERSKDSASEGNSLTLHWLCTALRGLIAAASLFLIVLLAYTTVSRIGFPYELEWDEGWTIDSMRRVNAGKGLWVEPSVEWLPYPYPPLYTYASAWVARIVGVGFLAARLVSLASAAGCLVLAFSLVRRETRSPLAGIAAAGFLAGTYPLAGTWFDVARVDTLFLFFVLAAMRAIRSEPEVRASVLAGSLMGLAYLTKQTALLPFACLSLFCLSELSGLRRFVLPAVGGAIIAGTTLVLSLLTGGWYFYYTVTVMSLHGLGQEHMLVDFWTKDLGLMMVPAALLGLFYLHRRFRDRSAEFVLYATLTVGMVGAAWTSRLHGGGWLNVLQPAHALLAVLFGLGLGETESRRDGFRWRAVPLYLIAALQLLLLPYRPSRHIPTAEDVRNGDAFVEAMRRIEGEVYTPMHGFLPTLAGKEVFVHDDYLLTVLRTGDAEVVGPLLARFREAFASQRFEAVVIDYEDYRFMDLLREHYRYAGDLPGSFRPRTGPVRAPQKLYLRKRQSR
jgi:hypothetical protein